MIPVPIQFSHWDWIGADYVWGSRGLADAIRHETEPEMGTSLIIVNYGCIVNAHGGIRNVEMDPPPAYMPILDRRVDPGAGGFSDHVNFRILNTIPLLSGDEQFISYGPNW